MISVEVCANSVQSAIAAEKGGAVRVELCANLADGGTTPAKSQIELTREKISIELNVIIRPRGGDFLYDDLDFETMKRDILLCGEIGCDGVVFGILDAEGNIDIPRNRILYDLAKQNNLSVTFHRAFDRVNNIEKALFDVIEIGCDRILTSGGKSSAYQGRDVLSKLVALSDDKLSIMAGAGVNENNVLELIKSTGVKEIHGTFQSLINGKMLYKNPFFEDKSEYSFYNSDKNRIQEIVNLVNN